jgi:glycoprotein-N-acetylgalactosamine 3-beta-galactosyltransferase
MEKIFYFILLLFEILLAFLIFSNFDSFDKKKKILISIKTEFPNSSNLLVTKSSVILNKLQFNQQINLLCIILTSKKSIFERGPAIWDTWSQKCNKTMFSLNKNDLTHNKSDSKLKFLNQINILNLPLNESYDKMAEKVLLTYKMMYELDKIKFNWYLLVDDDTFIYIDNLYKFIESTDSKMPYTYGYNFKQVVSTGYHSGGGGVLMPHESLKRIYESIIKNKCDFKEGYGDVALGHCSHISNVKIGNSTDSFGRERFHPLNVKDHYSGNYPGWIYSYAKNKVKSGFDCCSLDSISFHYVNKQDMYKMKKSKTYLDFIFNE